MSHPLDPLTAEEYRRTTAILRRDWGVDDRWRYGTIQLEEPRKGAAAPDREAVAICWNRDDGEAYKAVVSLTRDRVASWEHRPGEQPNATIDEAEEIVELLLKDQGVIEALARRGITDLDLIYIDVWNYSGAQIPPRYRGRRLYWGDLWLRASEHANPYAHPVNGLHPIVDANRMELLEVGDAFTVDPPQVMGEYRPDLLPMPLRDDLKPIEIAQPEGPSFTLDGNELRWQRWSMRIGFNPREGLVLHTVAYEDGGRTRSIAHRLSLAEMVVPYRDPTPEHALRMAFDVGEWGLGFLTTSLELGCDCLGEIRYLDAVVHDTRGEPVTIPNAICIHEEDDAILWKHVDEHTGAETRRARQLIVSFHVTVGNYEYLVYWHFSQDGTIRCEVRATGIPIGTYVDDGAPPYGTMVDQRTYAPFHQHFIVARLDLDVDGSDNTVYMSESVAPAPTDDDPFGLALVQREIPLRTEHDGMQDASWQTQRTWKVRNDRVRNGIGTPVAYQLVPGSAFPPILHPASRVPERAEVIAHTLWVTPYAEDERWPCGEFVIQSERDTGLPVWTAANRPIEQTDVVLWYVFGLHHITRPEDWPVMPVDVAEFSLRPFGFFDRNPALDVPPG